MAKSVAIIGSGLIGRSWGVVFARAGYEVRLYDPSRDAVSEGIAWIREALEDLQSWSLIEDAQSAFGRITASNDLEDSLTGVVYVQESASERLDVKTNLFRELDSKVPPDVPVGSSTSALLASDFCSGLRHKERCLVAHPVNPPHLIPLVELVPSRWTAEEITDQVRGLMSEVGQVPVRLKFEVPGFVLNRLQAALVNEAIALARDGVASVDDIDKTVRDGLGLRWAFIGPFETMDLNAAGGFSEYAAKFSQVYEGVIREGGQPKLWSEAVTGDVARQRRSILPLNEIGNRQRWRDQQIMTLLAQKRNFKTSTN